MKRLTAIFLISLTLLTFSNTAYAGFFGDIFEVVFGKSDKNPAKEPWTEGRGVVNNVRCKIEYTQLDLATGLEKTVEHTDQYNIGFLGFNESVMQLSAQDLTDKINNWLNESENNVITDLTIINCKERRFYISRFFLWHNEYRWDEYKSCPDEYNVKLIDLLDKPNQWGYNVNKTRLIKEYKDGCKNYELTNQLDRE
jgi:hypothetical protein